MANATPGVRPSWVDDELFPYESKFVELDGNTIHYVDEGEGPVLLLLHGNPTWSFLYRDIIARLHNRFRCVALDYPGFGLSSARPGFNFTVAEHTDVVEAFIDRLALSEITPMVQDWGGPIGLTAAGRHPDRYRAVIIGNTWGWPKTDLGTRFFSSTLGGPLGRFLIGRYNLFAARIVPSGHKRRTLTDAEMAHYTSPFPDESARVPTHVFPKEIPAARPLLGECEDGLAKLRDLPALIVWGDKDVAFKERERKKWEEIFTNHRTHVLAGAGHYIQDDAGNEIADTILDWWPPDEAGPAAPPSR